MLKLSVSVSGLSAGLVLASAAATPAFAQDLYAGGSIGFAIQNDSSNSGTTGAFTTGNGGDALPFGTAIADGTPYGWDTEFSEGTALSGEVGFRYDSGFRSGIELTWTQSDVDTHTGVTVGGGSIDGVDAGALTGSETVLGASVGDVVADGRGEIESLGLFANAYYDFAQGSAFQPYLGAGIGVVDTDVEYSPSGVGIIDDGETRFAWQVKAGASYALNARWQLFGEYTYRAAEDIEVTNDLFPGTLDIENTQNLFSIGARYTFGG